MSQPLYIDPDLLKYATPEELAAYENALKYELALQSPLDYACYVSPKTVRTPHAEFLNTILVRLIAGTLYHPRTGLVVTNLAISMPPRHGKSYLVSDHLPAWFETKYPMLNSAVIAYETEFAKSWGRKARDHVLEHPELGVIIRKDQQAADQWATTEGGFMFTAGRGGGITGKGIHLGVLDDLIKNSEEANSPTIRQSCYDTYISSIYNRKEHPKVPIILMNTRWHEDDLQGRLLAENPDDWYVLNLAALALDDDPLGREPGEALWPEKFDAEYLRDVRRTNQYWFAAQYQGQPHIDGGGLFTKSTFRYWAPVDQGRVYALQDDSGQLEYIPAQECTVFQTMDTAATTKTSSDYSVIATWAATKDRRLILIGLRRRRVESPDQLKWVKESYLADKAKYILIENKTFGLSLIQSIQRANSYGPHIAVRPSKIDGDHFTRAIPAAEFVREGRVYFPRYADFLGAFEHELEMFPNGTHDDQVDVLSIAVFEVTQGGLQTPVRNPRTEPATMQEKVDAQLEKMIRDRRRERRGRRHPVLGRM